MKIHQTRIARVIWTRNREDCDSQPHRVRRCVKTIHNYDIRNQIKQRSNFNKHLKN